MSDVKAHVAGLERLLRSVPFDAIVPGTDESLYVISRYRDRLAPLVTLGVPAHDTVLRAFDKSQLPRFAETADIASPASRICAEPDQAVTAADGFGYPVLVKPSVAVREVDGRLVRHASRLAADQSGVVRLQTEMGECIIQERLPGLVVSLAGVSASRGVIGSVLARHLRIWPPEAGSATFVECLPPDNELMTRVESLVAAIGWRGLWQLQFIQRPDGVLYAIDFNPRVYGCLGVAAAAGVPLVALWCAELLADPLPPVNAIDGTSWRREDSDVRNALWQLRSGDRRQALNAMLPRRHTTHAYFHMRDPAPFVAQSAALARTRLGRAFRERAG